MLGVSTRLADFLRQCGGASPAITSADDSAFGNSKIKPSHIDCDGFVRGRSIVACRRRIKKADQRYMRYLMTWLILLPSCALAQELSVQDRACITAAAAKLPPVTALKIEGSRVVAQPSAQGQRNSKLYHVKVEIDASVAGQTSTYVFNCVRDGQLTIVQPIGMR